MSRTAFIFPGQGAQYVGMGKEIYENFPEARRYFEEANEVLGMDLAGLCFEGPEDTLKETANTQPAILTVSLACLAVLEKEGIRPDYVAGLSLGEYSALVAAGSLDFADAVSLVRKRGQYMQEAVPLGQGTMAALMGLDRDSILEICSRASEVGLVEPANYNCPGQIVVAGETAAVERAIELAREAGARRAMLLPVSAPFHCSLMIPAGRRLSDELDRVTIEDVRLPVVANATADYVSRSEEIRRLLVKQVSCPVLWEDSVRRLCTDGVTHFVEVGPGRALSGFVKKIDKEAQVTNIEDLASLEKLLDSYGRVC